METAASQESPTITFHLYLRTVIFVGIILVGLSLWQIPTYQPTLHFGLLVGLAIASTLATASSAFSEKTGITYEVGSVVALASVLAFDPLAAVFLNTLFNGLVWVIKPADKRTWKKSLPQLGFNVGMQNISIFLSGWLVVLLYPAALEAPFPMTWAVWLLAGLL